MVGTARKNPTPGNTEKERRKKTIPTTIRKIPATTLTPFLPCFFCVVIKIPPFRLFGECDSPFTSTGDVAGMGAIRYFSGLAPLLPSSRLHSVPQNLYLPLKRRRDAIDFSAALPFLRQCIRPQGRTKGHPDPARTGNGLSRRQYFFGSPNKCRHNRDRVVAQQNAEAGLSLFPEKLFTRSWGLFNEVVLCVTTKTALSGLRV